MLLNEFPGIESTKLPLILYTRLNITFDWFAFGCSTLLEFLRKYVSPYYELEFVPVNPYDSDHFVLFLKESYMLYAANIQYYNQYQHPYYPTHYRFETDPRALSSTVPPAKSSQPHSVHASQLMSFSKQIKQAPDGSKATNTSPEPLKGISFGNIM